MTTPTKKQCSCEKCKDLCLGHPGRFDPGQVVRAAKHLGLNVREFFDRYLSVDYLTRNDGPDVDLLTPRWGDVSHPRLRFSDAFSKGRCALLTPTGCALPLELRPFECAIADHKSSGGHDWRTLLAKWDTPEGRAEIVEVLHD